MSKSSLLHWSLADNFQVSLQPFVKPLRHRLPVSTVSRLYATMRHNRIMV